MDGLPMRCDAKEEESRRDCVLMVYYYTTEGSDGQYIYIVVVRRVKLSFSASLPPPLCVRI